MCRHLHYWTVFSVHMRVRPADQARPHSMFPSTSAITYWQLEAEDSIINGKIVKGVNITSYAQYPNCKI